MVQIKVERHDGLKLKPTDVVRELKKAVQILNSIPNIPEFSNVRSNAAEVVVKLRDLNTQLEKASA